MDDELSSVRRQLNHSVDGMVESYDVHELGYSMEHVAPISR